MTLYVGYDVTAMCNKDSEIALVVDSSGSMIGSWNDTLEWMKKLVDAFEIDGTHHRMGVIMWNHAVIKKETILFSENLTGKKKCRKLIIT